MSIRNLNLGDKTIKVLVKPYICSECHEACDGHIVDFGIGSYEFWGQRGNDTNKQWVSDCCDAEVLDEEGNEVEPPEPDYPEVPEYD